MVFYPVISVKQAGQSFQEYMLAIVLVGVALIAALTLFGGNLSGSIFNMANGIKSEPPQIAAAATQGTPTAEMTNLQSAGKEMGALNAQALTSTATLSSTMSNAIETSGANGTTEELLALLEAKIPALLASKAITEEEASHLKDLANLGHQMADIEGMVEQAVTASNADASKLQASTFQYNNKTYNLSDFLMEIQMESETYEAGRPGLKDSVIGQFYALQNDLYKKMGDHEARELVEALANNIITIGDAVENTANDMQYGRQAVSTDFKKTVAANTDYNAMFALPSVDTHANSAAICQVNQSSDNGKSCK